VSAVDDGLALLGGLVLEDGRRWGDVAEPWQWALAVWLLDPDAPPSRWESRPRGGSKSTDAGAIAMVAMLTTLPAGSRAYAIAVDRDQGRLIVDACAGFVARTPALASAITVHNFTITARSGTVLEVLAADAASSWGLKPALVIADEFCQWPSTTNAKNLWQAVHSSMGKVPTAKLLVASTSGDPGHWSHKIYQAALKSPSWTVQDTPGPLSWASETFLAEQRAMLPESVYRRLHLNEWCAPEDRLTNVDDVHACVTLSGPQDPIPGQKYVIGVDLSMVKDRTAVSVMHAERSTDPDGHDVVQRFVLDRLEVWKPSKANPIDFGAVEAWIVHAAQQYRAHVYADPYQAAAMVQRIKAQGVPIDVVNFTPQSNNRMAVALHTTIRDHRLAIPDDEELIDELVNMRLVETSPNQFKLDHDPDKHNDRGVALSLAVMTLATTPSGRPEIVFAAGPAEGFAPDGTLLGVPCGPGGRFVMDPSDAYFLDRLGDGSW
jgi:phage terminase large subunit-like protein